MTSKVAVGLFVLVTALPRAKLAAEENQPRVLRWGEATSKLEQVVKMAVSRLPRNYVAADFTELFSGQFVDNVGRVELRNNRVKGKGIEHGKNGGLVVKVIADWDEATN